ncbi:hypothetical protein LLG96_01995 [bacterium]|nr:hypothetical protein [bacterium]
MKRNMLTGFVLLACVLAAGCAAFKPSPVQDIKGKNVVCILFKDTRFKTEVVGKVTGELAPKGCRVVTGLVGQAKYYKPADYGAVVYMTEYWMRHTPWHAKRYYKRYKQPENVIFVITSGDPDIVVKKPFDAVTSASKPDRVESVAREIITRLDRILGK